MFRKRIFYILFLIFLVGSVSVYAQEKEEIYPSEGYENVVESRYFSIYCKPDVDINKINRKIRVKYSDMMLGGYYSFSEHLDVEEKIGMKLDFLLKKVQKILDMYPRGMKLTIFIFNNQRQLDAAYENQMGQKNKEKAVSFYIHKNATIYTTRQAISREVLAHEMGHAVSDHYFLILPPASVKEVLAQYVESHLDDGFKRN